MKNNLKKKGKLLSIAKDCEVEVSIQEDGFRGSWYRAILEQNPTRVTGKKLRVSYKTMFNEDGVSPLKETIERSFIRPVPPECLNEGVVFKEGSVVDAYFNNGWWTGVIVVERPDGSFLVYFDDPPDIMRFIRSQLRPHADWIGSKWVKSKNKVLSQHMFTRGKLVEMTREISESEKEKIWVRALVITEVRKQGDDRRKFLIKRCTISQNSSDEAEGKHLIVDICKIRPSPPRDLCAEYSLNDYVEVVVTHGWRKGRVTEILLENKYKVYFAATKEDAVFNYTEIRLSMEWLGGGSWIRAHEREFENNAGTPIRPGQDSPSNTLATDEDDTLNDDATKIRSDQESPSITLVLESNEEDKVNDDATEITSSLERHRNTSVLEATEAETQNHETIYGKELPLPHESEDMMDDVATPIIDPQEIPRGETMSESNDKIALPKRISETGTKGVVLQRINKRSNLKLVGKVETLLGKEFKKLEDSFLAPVIKMGRKQKLMVFSRHLIHHLLLRRIDIGEKGLWFTFGEQLMRFSLREFHLTTGLPCVVDKDEDEAETSATKKKKKDPWMNKNQTLNTLLKLLVEKSKELTADQRLRLGATILVEGILMASNPVTSIPEERLLRARNFKEFCKYPWGNLAFDYLLKEVKSFTYAKLTENNQYAICGFIYALQLWALSSVNQLGTFFGISDDGIQFPLCLHWKETKALTIEEVNRFDQMEKVDVKCILGDPGLHSDLVEDVDCEFGRVVDLVKRGYRLKRQDWLNRSVDIAVAEAEVDENNSVPGIDATDQEKIEFLNNKVVSLEERVKYLEGLLNIRGETVKETEKSKETEAATKTKVNGQNADYELDENEVLGVYIDAKRKEIAKRKKNGVRPPREVGHQDEDDVEVEVNEEQPQEEEEQQQEDDTEDDVDDGDKESENPETNEGQTQEEEEQHQEDDAEVNEEQPQEEEEQQEEEDTEDDVDDGDKESENPETNEEQKQEEEEQQQEDDTEVNTDVDVGAKENGSENPVKGSKKRGRKVNISQCIRVYKMLFSIIYVTFFIVSSKLKDGEENEDAYEKPVKVTRKSERVTKVNISLCIMLYKMLFSIINVTFFIVSSKLKGGEVNEDASEKPMKGTRKSKRGTKGGEVNEDASEKPMKGTRKSKRGTKVNISLCIMLYKMLFSILYVTFFIVSSKLKDGEENEYAYEKPVKVTRKSERVTKGKKKGVTPPREVQQQVEDHAETNEDGEGNEDASKKHVKFTKKNGRGNKEHNVGTPKSKKQKKQFEKDSADDVIGSVLEDLKNAD
ncbi:uncharacterized protein LOC117132925 isoform X5 [Brassica rapa]|nr:uncharacterized protein LOC117127410 isoform X12 [Brassica rapa]XP_033134534.1 uncharacterized protein LOC117127863 isoform X8 [Brassica rapa]XP_033136112.1 uncharacterized protein LOC103847885 isoform X5 [Brassica rapa]XP_033137736.1 uncharacterized protein LOC117128925 isoform X5 [Brassica rapa]XP_033142860.1 uncharacterized protein LOC117132521 isoform X13 [Brassica rapa]XP_033144369.1 uncharacterized protein LOC117132925 isoform X5 [Brassica rapa]XP_048591027.1 uncharacterized protein 